MLIILPSRRLFLCPIISPAIPPRPRAAPAPAGPDRLAVVACQALVVALGRSIVSLATTCIRFSMFDADKECESGRRKSERVMIYRVHSSVVVEIVMCRARLFWRWRGREAFSLGTRSIGDTDCPYHIVVNWFLILAPRTPISIMRNGRSKWLNYVMMSHAHPESHNY